MKMRDAVFVVGLLFGLSCSPLSETTPDAGPLDAGVSDAGLLDAGRLPDAGPGGGDAGCTQGFDLNDVSFLFPLPGVGADAGLLLSVRAAGDKGLLLPDTALRALPGSLVNNPSRDTPPADARVVAVRVDPCFGSPCQRQIRLVAQPLNERGETVDATLHLFYTVDDAEFAAVVTGLRELKARANGATTCQPLSIHPVMRAEGLEGQYATLLRTFILRHCGAQTLTRVAVMTFGGTILSWNFSAFAVDAGTSPVAIARAPGALSQTFLAQAGPRGGPKNYGVMTPTPSPSRLPRLLEASVLAAEPVADLQLAIDETWRIENPRLETPQTVDCASCHLAGRARALASTDRSVTADQSTQRYMNRNHNMGLIDDGRGVGSQRSFGYFGSSPSLTQRVVNESAEVADQLNAGW